MPRSTVGSALVSTSVLKDLFRQLADGSITEEMLTAVVDHKVIYPEQLCQKYLNLKKLLEWLKKNSLDMKLIGGLMGQIAEQEKFYQKFYGSDFRIDRKKIRVAASRLAAIKAALEAGSVNYALIKVVPDAITDTEAQMTGAEFFYERLMKPLKKDGFKIWAENGTDRWSGLTLAELLRRGVPVEPEEIDAVAFKTDWVKEEVRVIKNICLLSAVKAGSVEIIFTSNLADIPNDQAIINKDGEIVKLDDRSYVSGVVKKVRVLARDENIVLACQCWAKDKTYLARNTWDWLRDLVDHMDKRTSPPFSVASADSSDSEFGCYSRSADHSHSDDRFRLAL